MAAPTPPSRNNPDTFNDLAEAYLAWMSSDDGPIFGEAEIITDANTATGTGPYAIQDVTAATNIPAGLTSGPATLFVFGGHNSSNFSQVIIGLNASGSMWRRNYRAAAFQDWIMVFSEGDSLNSGAGNDLIFMSDDVEGMRLDQSQNLGVGTTAPTEKVDVNGDAIRVRTAQTPASAGATGTTGMICWDANYIYVCTATNVWKRAALATW